VENIPEPPDWWPGSYPTDPFELAQQEVGVRILTWVGVLMEYFKNRKPKPGCLYERDLESARESMKPQGPDKHELVELLSGLTTRNPDTLLLSSIFCMGDAGLLLSLKRTSFSHAVLLRSCAEMTAITIWLRDPRLDWRARTNRLLDVISTNLAMSIWRSRKRPDGGHRPFSEENFETRNWERLEALYRGLDLDINKANVPSALEFRGFRW